MAMKENWFLIGDIHGEAGPIGYFYNQNKDRLKLDDFKNNIILLGDVCCNYYVNSRDKRFKKDLSVYPFTYICLRGNHESRVTDVVAKNQDGCFDLVISHTCPKIFEPRDLFLASIDQSAVDKTMELYLDEIETSLSYSRWVWGHYHDDRLYPWDGDKEKLMLKNEKVVDLVKYMNMSKKDYLEDIQA